MEEEGGEVLAKRHNSPINVHFWKDHEQIFQRLQQIARAVLYFT